MQTFLNINSFEISLFIKFYYYRLIELTEELWKQENKQDRDV